MSSTAILDPKAATSHTWPRGPLLRFTSPLRAPPKTRALNDNEGPDTAPNRSARSLMVTPGSKSKPARPAFPCSQVVGAVNGPNTLLNFPACTVSDSRRSRPCLPEFRDSSKPSKTCRKFSPRTSADPFRIWIKEGQAPPGAINPITPRASSRPGSARETGDSDCRISSTTFIPSSDTECTQCLHPEKIRPGPLHTNSIRSTCTSTPPRCFWDSRIETPSINTGANNPARTESARKTNPCRAIPRSKNCRATNEQKGPCPIPTTKTTTTATNQNFFDR